MLGGLDFDKDINQSLYRKIIDAIRPILENELETSANVHTAELKSELEKERKKCETLSINYQNLQREMERSREIFERKKAEWQALKEVLSQKQHLRVLFNSHEPDDATSVNTAIDSSVETGLFKGRVNPPRVYAQPSPGPILDLVAMVDDDGSSMMDDDGSSITDIPIDAHPETKPAQSPVGICDDRKRESPKYHEALRSKAARKQAHAKDCPCCSKFYDLAGVEGAGDRDLHVKNVSRHRFMEEIQSTPPGFWDVNFTPRQ